MKITAYDLAKRFDGKIKEIPGADDHPLVVFMLQLAARSRWPDADEIPWCSAFVYFIAFLLDLRRPHEKGLRARSWLLVGDRINLLSAERGNDIVVLKRGGGNQPGPDVVNAKGHVGFLDKFDGGDVLVLGGNQSNAVNVSRYPIEKILSIQRLYWE